VEAIQKGAFKDCINLSDELVIPSNVSMIGKSAFNGCKNISKLTIENGVKRIEGYAFSDCLNIKEVFVPESVEVIQQLAFDTNIDSLKVDENNKKYDSRDNCNAIIETATNKLILGCRNTIIPNGIVSIGDYAFSYCEGLGPTLTLPDTVTSIGCNSFNSCHNLKTIYWRGKAYNIKTLNNLKLNSLVKSAKAAAQRDGYNQVIYEDDDFEGLSFSREPIDVDEENVVGRVITTWRNGTLSTSFIEN
jgi:hypothetical protein